MKVYGKKPNTDNVLSMLTPRIAERKSFNRRCARLKGQWPEHQEGIAGNVRTLPHGRVTAP